MMIDLTFTRAHALAGLGLAAVLAVASCDRAAETDASAAPAGETTVRIDFGDDAKEIGAIPFTDGATIMDVMLTEAGAETFALEYSGSGAMAFVTSIDGVANEGVGPERRNWTLLINGECGQVGAGAYQLQPDDKILWRFADEDSACD